MTTLNQQGETSDIPGFPSEYFLGGKSQENGQGGRKEKKKKTDKTERAMGVGRRTRGDSKVESNDSPEIPDKGETSDIPGLPSGSSYDDDVYLYNDGDEEVKVDGATK